MRERERVREREERSIVVLFKYAVLMQLPVKLVHSHCAADP